MWQAVTLKWKAAILGLALAISAGSFAGPQPLMAQTEEMSDMEMMERVAALQDKLNSRKVTERDEAQKALLELGPGALEFIEPPTDETESDVRARLIKITSELEKKGAELATKNTTLTLSGKFTVEQALAEIKKLTGNDVALADRIPVAIAEKTIEVDFKDTVFWEAMSDVMEKAGVEVDPYGGDPGQLRLQPKEMAIEIDPATGQPVEKKVAPVVVPRAMSGVFDVQVTRVDSMRNLRQPQLNHSNIHLLIRWEPRIRPISVDLPMVDVKAVDEYDKPIAVTNPEAVLSGIVQPEIPEVDFPLTLNLVDRQIENIKSLELKIDTVLPGRVETFKFKKLGDLEDGTQQRKAGAVVTYGGIRKNEDLFGLVVKLSFDEDNNALESHQSWVFNNEAFLKNAEGERINYVGFETIQQDKAQVSVQYYFVKDPADCTLFYKTPAAVVKVPVTVVLKKIPMP